MVVFYISGGLSNKMFQYAFSLKVKQLGYKILYDTHTFKSEFAHDKVQLTDIFPNVKIENCVGTPFRYIGQRDLISKIVRRFSRNYIFEKDYQYNQNAISSISKHCCIDGLWQDSRYFESCESFVRNAYQFPELEDEQNIGLLKSLKKENSVAIHIRKNDGYGSWNIFSNTCTKEYYDKAINYIKQQIKKPVFFVFSDNPEIIKNYLGIIDYKLIAWNPKQGIKNYLDMQLMSNAKHNIIANSTYSWWSAWLNTNPNKIIIAPKNWINPDMKKIKNYTIVPNLWIKI
jgi:hypothetical protein